MSGASHVWGEIFPLNEHGDLPVAWHNFHFLVVSLSFSPCLVKMFLGEDREITTLRYSSQHSLLLDVRSNTVVLSLQLGTVLQSVSEVVPHQIYLYT